MLRLVANLMLGGASSACGFAAVAVALYGGGPAQASAVALFAGFGFVTGLACGGLHAVIDGPPAQPAAAMPPKALASLVRATLARAVAERAPRAGSAADHRRACHHHREVRRLVRPCSRKPPHCTPVDRGQL